MPAPRQGISELPHICLAHGLRHVVISPGSRNAPLILSFTSHDDMECISISDERSAAYYALGMAQQLNKPVAIICTSGTAVANLTPAIAEALYLKVPLLVLTADRPLEWIDQNDGQTIRQDGIFSNVVKQSFTTPVETQTEGELWHFRRIINQAIQTTQLGKAGPVHINIPLREPLYEILPPVNTPPSVMKVSPKDNCLMEEEWMELRRECKNYKKIMVVCGFNAPKAELTAQLQKMADSGTAVILAENLSNSTGAGIIDTPERFMAMLKDDNQKELQPELLITTGGAVISKRLKKYLRRYKPRAHWHIDENEFFVDTYQCLSRNIPLKPECFFREMQEYFTADADYAARATAIQQQSWSLHDAFLAEAEFSDLPAYAAVFNQLPGNINLHLANSTPVRYAQLFPSRKDIHYYSNRGTSGIDGCISTAAGASMVTDKMNVLLLGDLAFIYDSNGLWNNALPANLRIVVMDNGGGNIFKLIETGPGVEKIRPFIETPHKVQIADLCKAYGVEYIATSGPEELKDILPGFFKPNRLPVVLHIQTCGETSARTFKQYFQHINKNEHEKNLDNTEGIQ